MGLSDTINTTGAPIQATFSDGNSYTLSPVTLAMWGEISAEIKTKKLAAVTRILQDLPGLPTAVHDRVIAAAVKQSVEADFIGADVFGQFLNSYDGLLTLLRHMLLPSHPELHDRAKLAALVKGMPPQVLQGIVETASGLPAAKNS